MVGEHQRLLLRRAVEDAALARRGLLRQDVEDRHPVRMLQVERIEHDVGDVQQLLTVRGDGQRNVSGCVSRRWR